MHTYYDYTTIEAVKRVDIVNLADSLGLSLKKAGANYRCLSPFTEEKTPSFIVNPSKNLFKCFSSDRGGDTISLVEAINNVGFVEAVKYICEQFSITAGYLNGELAKESVAEQEVQKTKRKLLEWAKNYFLSNQLIKASAIEVWRKARGFSEETLKTFALGYGGNSDTFATYILRVGVEEIVLEMGLLSKSQYHARSYYSLYKERIIFPIYDVYGRLVALVGRITQEGGSSQSKQSVIKYINSPDSLWTKGNHLYGMHLCKEALRKVEPSDSLIYILEGYTDVLRFHECGIKESVATMGTALTDRQCELLKRHTSTVCLVADNDTAGIKAMERNAEKLIAIGLVVEVLIPQEKGQDPDTCLKILQSQSKGSTAIKRDIETFLSERKDYILEYKLTYYQKEAKKSIKKKVAAIKQLGKLVDFIPDPLYKQCCYEELVTLWKDFRKYPLKKDSSISTFHRSVSQESLSLGKRLFKILNKIYDIRFNTIKQANFYKEKKEDIWRYLDERARYSMFWEVKEVMKKISYQDFHMTLYSKYVEEYDPFKGYFSSLESYKVGEPDHIAEVSKKITLKNPHEKDILYKHLKKWLVRTIHCALENNYINKHALFFISQRHNIGKSTFFNWLMPDPLREYCTANIQMNKDGLIALAKSFIINLDDMDQELDINNLKSYLSRIFINERQPYARDSIYLERRASFVGSCNNTDILNDPTGSVRWLCFEVDEIDFKYLSSHRSEGLWCQAYQLYLKGFNGDLNKEDIEENEGRNQQYMQVQSEEELFHHYFRKPEDKEIGKWLSVSNIINEINRCSFLKISTDKKIRMGRIVSGFVRKTGIEKKMLHGSPQYKLHLIEDKEREKNSIDEAEKSKNN